MADWSSALAVACAIAVVAACSKSPPNGAAAQAITGNACDRKLLTAADAAGILSDPITGSTPIPGDSQACKFTTASFSSITVTLCPGLGRATVKTWNSGRMPVAATSLAGVGEEAAWAEDLHEVIAEQNDLLCDVQVTGLAGSPGSGSTAAQQKAIGELCNKIFAADRRQSS